MRVPAKKRGRPPINRERAIELVRSGLPLKAIAERLGCSPNSLTEIARVATNRPKPTPVPRPRYQKVSRDKVRELHSLMSLTGIAKALGCSKTTVKNIQAELGLPERNKRTAAETHPDSWPHKEDNGIGADPAAKLQWIEIGSWPAKMRFEDSPDARRPEPFRKPAIELPASGCGNSSAMAADRRGFV